MKKEHKISKAIDKIVHNMEKEIKNLKDIKKQILELEEFVIEDFWEVQSYLKNTHSTLSQVDEN